MIIGFSGHRPQAVGGFAIPNPTYTQICQDTEKLLLELKPEKCISGMALGFDQWVAFICMKLGIPFIAAVPFLNQEKMWPKESQETYHKLLTKASEVIIVSGGGYSAQKMQIRNEWIADNSDEMIFCWNGIESGGTWNCLQYARQQNKPIHIIEPI